MPWTSESPTVTGMVDLGVGGFNQGNYKFRVRARDAMGQVSAWSGIKLFYMPGDPEVDIDPPDFNHVDVIH